jgi:hypothetical protein
MTKDDSFARRLESFLKGPRNAWRLMFSAMGREADLMLELQGRSVAVVGNARALEGRVMGDAIEAHDLVLRFNRAPIPDPRSHGRRTDWIAAGAPIGEELAQARGVSRVIWVTKLRKMPDWMYQSERAVMLPRRRQDALARTLGARPSSGLFMIDLLARSRCRAATLYGFDFFQTRSLSGGRGAAEVPHDFGREKEWVRELIARDRRFSIDGAAHG